MAILKIRDENGNVQEIRVIKGDKGDKGDAYVLTKADKQEIADLISQGGFFYTKAQADAKFLTEAQVLDLIQSNMPTSAEGVDY